MKDLYRANQKELLEALRDGNITRDNVSSTVKIYEAQEGYQNILEKIDTGFEVNLKALRELL